ncbi:MAG TPA: response regulator transcription factor [Jatrophihabitantaceae bacterium]|nr:response regulator transcription factor [Jatrophihabitantaceae bacterium]
MTIRVVIADDHAVVRDGLAALLSSRDGIELVGVAANGRDAVRAAVTERPDVLLLDVSMPDLDGVAAAGEIARSAPDVGILMLTMHDDADTVRAATRAGARGYVLKGASQDQIVRAIEAVAGGDSIFGGEIARQVLDAAAGRADVAPDPFPTLSVRERQILDLLAAGLPSATIAAKLGVTAKTVNNHLSSVFAKLGVSGRTEAALLARRAGLGGG